MNSLMVLISVISYDIWFYISHIILHREFMYAHHKLHHSKLIPTARDTYLASSVETVFQGVGIFYPTIYLTINSTSQAYLVEIISYDYLLLALFIVNIRGMMAHDRRFIWLIGNHHLLHHKYNNCNYGQFWIDYLLGTCHQRQEEYRYGIIYT